MRLRKKGFGGDIPLIEKMTPVIFKFSTQNRPTFVSYRARSFFAISDCN